MWCLAQLCYARGGRATSARELSQRAQHHSGFALLNRLFGRHVGEQFRTQRGFDLGNHLRVLLQEVAHVVFALTDSVSPVAVPSAGLVNRPCLTPNSISSPSREVPSP